MGDRSALNLVTRIFTVVEIKLIAPKIELAPAKWREKIARSTGGPLWAITPERGG